MEKRPCPFCGSTRLRYDFQASIGYIRCINCGAQGPYDPHAADPDDEGDRAWEAWNKRTPDEPM